MKQKIKRHSRSVISVLLAVCMLISCMTVGLIATDAAKISKDESVGYNSAKLYYKKSNSGTWSTGSNVDMTMSNNNNTGTASLSLEASSTYYFVIVANNGDWWGNNPFNLSKATSKTNNLGKYYNFSAGSTNVSQNPNTLNTSSSGSYTFTITLDSGSCTVSGGDGGGSSVCSNDKTYRIVGTAGIAGTAWSNTATANNMTYDATLGCYKKTYSNIAASTAHDFRIIEGSTWSNTWGFDRANVVDESNIVNDSTGFVVKPTVGSDNGDNNIRLTVDQKANVEIRLDDSKTTTSAITVIVTPAIITVTAGSCYVNDEVYNATPAPGSITVNDGASVTNIAQGGTITAKAVANDHWHFDSWRQAEGLTFDNSNRATATVTVTGSATVNANFAKDKYTVTKDTDATYTLTTSATSVAWGDSVTVTATPASGYAVDSVWYSTDGGTTKTTIASAASGNFDMPTSNVTVGAVTHALTKNAVYYSQCTGQTDYGYVNAGMKYSDTTNVTKTIESGAEVLEGDTIVLGARPAAGYKFVGWYLNDDTGSGTAASTDEDYVVTSPSGSYYAKFESLTVSSGVRIYVPSDSSSEKLWVWGLTSPDTNPAYAAEYKDRKTVAEAGTQVNFNGSIFYEFKFPNSNSVKFRLGNNEDAPVYTTGTHTVTNNSTSTSYAPTFDLYYPIKFNVTNPDKGTAYAPLFGKKSTATTFNHTPSNTDDWKTSRTTVNFASASILTDDKTTATTTSSTMPDTYDSANPPTFTVTFVEKEYFPVTFSSGPNGKVEACTGTTWDASKAIKSGTLIKEGENVTFKATANSGYTFTKWTTSAAPGTSLDTNATKYWTVNTTNQGLDRKGWFARSTDKGTEISGKYLAYGTDINYQVWTTGLTLYHKNGRVYAYIDSPTNSETYYFAVCDNNNPKNNFTGGNLAAGTWGWTKDETTCVTDFTGYLTNTDVQQYNTYWDYNDGNGNKLRGTNYYGKTTVSSASVSQLIIDVGEWNGTDLSYDNSYRVTPVYDTDETNIDIYAKDGSYRGDSTYDYFPGIADTVLSAKSGSTVSNITHQSEFDTGSAMRGQTIVVTTTIDKDHKGDFFIRGFSFNGVTPALLTESDGVANGTGTAYSQEYTIPADFDCDYLEITPIYYYKYGVHGVTADNVVQFYIENYDKALEATGWGNTLSVYPYYQSGSSWVEKKQNAFGGYPGQPVIYYGGRRFVEIPTYYATFTYDNNGSSQNCTIKGVTLSNDYWDIVHREYCHAVTEHKQTYDYDDFVKIFRETTDGQEKNGKTGLADQITFQFKYRTTTNNFSDSAVTSADKNTGSTAAGNTVHQPYASFSETEKTSKFGNGWEPLLDYLDRPVDLFGKQLTDAQKELDPILVVSDDYEVTYAGSYATTWTVYARANASDTTYTKIAEIAPSALIVTSKTRLDNTTLYPVTEDRGGLDPTTLQEFSSAYNTLLSYKERPVQITYEKAIENNSTYEKYFKKSGVVTNGWTSEKAVRNDGRWTYSYYNDDVHANILIEYKNDESDSDWTVDAFKGDTNQGTVTGARAYFTNTDNNKAGNPFTNLTETGIVVSDQNKYYEFEATPASGYVFAGWWFSRDNIETSVNEDITKLDGHSQMTSNATFIARYIKSPTGTLTVNHTLDSGSVGTGRTYVAVKAIDKSTSEGTWLTGAQTEADHFTENTFAISDTYIGYKKGYSFEITLMSVRDSDFDVFDRFSAANDVYSQTHFSADEVTVSDPSITYSSTFTVDVDDMFAINDKGYPAQLFDSLTYFSTFEQLNIAYKLVYQYNSMIGANTYYGTQSYKVEGIFTKAEFTKYLTYNAALQTNDHAIGWYELNNNAKEFLAKKSPHEADIRHTLTWDFRDSLGSISYFKNNTSNGWDGQITVTKEATDDPNSTRRLQFIMPYRATNTNDGTIAEKTNGKVIELASDAESSTTIGGTSYSKYLTKNDLAYATPYTLSDSGDPVYVTAEPVIYDKTDNTKAKYFQYWQVYAIPDDINTSVAPTAAGIDELEASYIQHQVAKCYNLGFNLSVYQNYAVVPVYSETQSTKEHSDEATITWAENGRNQWNDTQGNAKWAFGDRIFSDFMITFDRRDKLMLKELSDHSVTTGLITEKLDTILDANATSVSDAETWKVQSEKYYHDLYATRDAEKTEIGAYISGRAENLSQGIVGYTGMTYNSANSKFVLGDANVYENSFINLSNLDNKNRIEFTKVVPKLSQSDKSDTGRKDYVYRAYAYMIDWNVDESGNPTTIKSVKISDPVYYTIYDIATIENGIEMSKYNVS